MNQDEFQNIANNEIKGAEAAVKKMLLYYVSALQTSGVTDVKQYIATKISNMIDFSDEQYKFVISNFQNDNKFTDNLNNCIKLLIKMKREEKLDLESIDIILNVLNLIIKDYAKI